MSVYSYKLVEDKTHPVGLVVLQVDETIERDMRRLLKDAQLYVTRVPSDLEVSAQSLKKMTQKITAAASLLPQARRFSVVGYGCTSATAQIGADKIANLVQAGARTAYVSEPLSALVAACQHLGLKRLAFLSPYVAEVSDKLRDVLYGEGIETPVFGSFAEAEEARVVRIDASSIMAAARDLCALEDVEALFLSCTNLRTLDVIAPLEQELGMPVLSSNLVLAWHLAKLSGYEFSGPGKLQ